jgi:hypothetical protein
MDVGCYNNTNTGLTLEKTVGLVVIETMRQN